MNRVNMTDLKKFFYSHPVFRYETFAEFMTERKIVLPNSWRKSLQYHVRAGNIVLIKRGLYGVLNPMMDNKNTFYIDPYLVAGVASEDSIIAYHTALELHNVAYTTFETLTFLTKKHMRSFSFQTQKYKAIQPPNVLFKRTKDNFAVETITRSNVMIKVTNIERTIVDVIARPEISGGWEEILRSLEHLVVFNVRTLIDYLMYLNNASIIAKVGFFLDMLITAQGIDKVELNQLLKYIPKQPCYLERSKREKGCLVKKWNIIVPEKVLKCTWEENPDVNI